MPMKKHSIKYPDSKRGLYPNNSIYTSGSVFNLHQFELKNLAIETGFRYNFIQIKIEDNTIGKIRIKPRALVHNFGITYTLNNKHQLYTSISSGYRAPNIDDMGTLGIVDFRYEVPTYDLKPEKSLNKEIGYKINQSKVKLNASIFMYN